MPELDRYLTLLGTLAEQRGGALAPIDPAKIAARFHESDAVLFRRGIDAGLLRVDDRGYLHSADPFQTTAWLVEGGEAAWPCWEYLPHAASYVELILDLGFPVTAVRFETSGVEHKLDLDLAVVDADGAVLVVGEAKKTSKEVDSLLLAMRKHVDADPGYPVGVRGQAQAAWKLAYRLWATRAPWLWLVGPSDRRAYRVTYRPTLELELVDELPKPAEVGLATGPAKHPRIVLTPKDGAV